MHPNKLQQWRRKNPCRHLRQAVINDDDEKCSSTNCFYQNEFFEIFTQNQPITIDVCRSKRDGHCYVMYCEVIFSSPCRNFVTFKEELNVTKFPLYCLVSVVVDKSQVHKLQNGKFIIIFSTYIIVCLCLRMNENDLLIIQYDFCLYNPFCIKYETDIFYQHVFYFDPIMYVIHVEIRMRAGW